LKSKFRKTAYGTLSTSPTRSSANTQERKVRSKTQFLKARYCDHCVTGQDRAGAEVSKTGAEDFLCAEGKLKRKEAREELDAAMQSGVFAIEPDQKQDGRRGKPRGILKFKKG
jgi:hypothetical protein